MPMSEDKDNIKFRLAVEDRRHNELTGLLKQLIDESKKEDGKESELTKLIQKSNGNIDVFLSKVQELSKPQAISVNAPPVNVNQVEVVNELKLVVQELKNNKPPMIEKKEWEFKVIRSQGGGIDKVIATQK